LYLSKIVLTVFDDPSLYMGNMDAQRIELGSIGEGYRDLLDLFVDFSKFCQICIQFFKRIVLIHLVVKRVLTTEDRADATKKAASRSPCLRAFTASFPPVEKIDELSMMTSLSASSCRATALVPLPSGPTAIRF
jgi:hypothetical protein